MLHQLAGLLARRSPSSLAKSVAALSAAQFISVMGTQVTMVALPWFVLTVMHQPLWLGPLFFARMLPEVIAGPWMGTLADRLRAKPFMVASHIGQGVSQLVVVALWHAGLLNGWSLVGMVLVQSFFGTPFQTNRAKIIRAIADAGGPPVRTTNAALQSSLQVANLLGPAGAASLIGFVGMPLMELVLLDAASFFVSALLIRHTPLPESTAGGRQSSGTYWHDLKDGLRYAISNRLVLALIIPGIFDAFVYFPTLQVLLPVYVKQTLAGDTTVYAVMLSLMAAGALAGSVVLGYLLKRVSMRWVFAICFTGHVLPLWLLWGFPSRTTFYGGMLLVGACVGPIMVALNTLLQGAVRREYVSRVFSFTNTVIVSFMLAGYLTFGQLINQLPANQVLMLSLAVGMLGAATSWDVLRAREAP